MRLSVLLILLILNSAFGPDRMAEFFVDKPTHKFPSTREGILLHHTFTVKNTGEVPLVISNYEVACPCTKVTLPKPIAPGATGELKVEFDTKGKYYQQDRKIILHTNTRKKTETLRFKVYVIPEGE